MLLYIRGYVHGWISVVPWVLTSIWPWLSVMHLDEQNLIFSQGDTESSNTTMRAHRQSTVKYTSLVIKT